jgi:hypothetical protein
VEDITHLGDELGGGFPLKLLEVGPVDHEVRGHVDQEPHLLKGRLKAGLCGAGCAKSGGVPLEREFQRVLNPDMCFVLHEGTDLVCGCGIIPPVLEVVLVDKFLGRAPLCAYGLPIEEGFGQEVHSFLLGYLHISVGGP